MQQIHCMRNTKCLNLHNEFDHIRGQHTECIGSTWTPVSPSFGFLHGQSPYFLFCQVSYRRKFCENASQGFVLLRQTAYEHQSTVLTLLNMDFLNQHQSENIILQLSPIQAASTEGVSVPLHSWRPKNLMDCCC